ncbi:phosphatidylserine decarboxylase family protein [Moniliophthora roreri MCA 2997]|uniref:Phosphatidylserine decarboxylase family protein n=1 Tax=Moniliophthora roreri (strain MCA 2997) TaxID=1381753 RepID=V2WNR0_MONRO|nr:phosphatidylserine decarboxylase family protein [Moniliophthora roreri MCA 2997]
MATVTLRPPVEAFRRTGWLPVSQEVYNGYMKRLKEVTRPTKRVPSPGTIYDGVDKAPELLEPIKEFKDFIETNAVVYTDVVRMFDEITDFPSTYQEMLLVFNEIFRKAPSFGSLGPPMYMVMARVMNTEGGFSAFTKQIFNHYMKRMLKAWELYLLSKDSTNVLNSDDGGWFSDKAMDAMMKEFPNRTFQEVFICDPGAPAWGYTSYEDFFNRRFRTPEIDRPTGDIKDLTIVSAACECSLYAIQNDVKRVDELFIKDEAYSLVHLLANDESVDSFVGGTVIQSFLNITSYHRWHAPVNGVIRKIVEIPGTYFAQAPSTIGLPIPDDDSDLPPYLKSLTYFANTAARMLIFIQADNASIGLMCFIAIGMTEISSCQATIYEGQHVNRGDELGMFHFGGSSCALLFNKTANVRVSSQYTKPGAHLPVNAPIAVADPPS